MADDMRIALEAIARKLSGMHDGDILREGVRMLAHALMEAEVETHVGASPHERTAARTGQRNGYRERAWDTRVGTIDLPVPRVRDGSYAPSLLEPRRRAEQVLSSVVQQAYVAGVSTRRVDNLVRALGMDGISRSQVSRICQGLDDEVRRFRERALEGPYPYVWLDATFVKARQDGRVASLAVLVAIGVTVGGRAPRPWGRGVSGRGPRVVDAVPAEHGRSRALGRSPGHERRARSERSSRTRTGSASRDWRYSWMTPARTCSPIWTSRPTTGARCGRRTRSSS